MGTPTEEQSPGDGGPSKPTVPERDRCRLERCRFLYGFAAGFMTVSAGFIVWLLAAG